MIGALDRFEDFWVSEGENAYATRPYDYYECDVEKLRGTE